MQVDSDITGIEVIAGAGVRRKIDDIDWLMKKYPGYRKEDWQKVKGYGKVIFNGIEREVELHWYEVKGEPSSEVEMKVVKYFA